MTATTSTETHPPILRPRATGREQRSPVDPRRARRPRGPEPVHELALPPGANRNAIYKNLFDAHVELEPASENAARAFPGRATHLRSCPGCRTDYEGLLEPHTSNADAE